MMERNPLNQATLLVGLSLLSFSFGCGDTDQELDDSPDDTSNRHSSYEDRQQSEIDNMYPDIRVAVEEDVWRLNKWTTSTQEAAPGDTILVPVYMVASPDRPDEIIVPEGGMEVVYEVLANNAMSIMGLTSYNGSAWENVR